VCGAGGGSGEVVCSSGVVACCSKGVEFRSGGEVIDIGLVLTGGAAPGDFGLHGVV
jgi:hypothetical protein